MLDNTFTNQTNYLVRIGLLINDISEQWSFAGIRTCNYETDKHKYDTFKCASNVKEDDNVFLLIENLRQEEWDNVLQADYVNLAHSNFVNIFNTLYNYHCPVETATIKQTCKNKLCAS